MHKPALHREAVQNKEYFGVSLKRLVK
jgi:hypothetical protein